MQITSRRSKNFELQTSNFQPRTFNNPSPSPKPTSNFKLQTLNFKLSLFFLLLSFPAFSQPFTPAQVRDDLLFLQRALYRGHPGAFRYVSRDSMNAVFEQLQAAIPRDSVTADEAHVLIRRAVAAVRDGHTSVETPFFDEQTRVMPLMAQIAHDCVYVWRNYSGDTSLRRGLEIRAVNGVPAADLLHQCRAQASGDGFNTTFADVLASVYFARYVRLFQGNKEHYTIETYTQQQENRVHTLAAKSRADLQKLQEIRLSGPQVRPKPPILRNRSMTLSRDTARPDVAILKMTDFPNRGYRRFYRKMFTWLDAHQMKSLVVDLRNNTGGNIRNMDFLIAQIVDVPFGYDYVRNRRTRIGKYLGLSAKYTLAAVWLKYNFQPGFRYRREGGQHVQRWRVKPKKRHNFDGKTWVLTNGWSFSSASMCASFLQHKAGATVVGTETGGNEVGNCGGGFPRLVLPNTRFRVRFPLFQLRYQLGLPDTGHGVMPDLPTPYHIEDLLRGRDLEMERIRK
jgi:C-terminal processing protease CtpA/Prc